MRTLKLTVAYDGTNYHGFQKQTNALTVQQVLEEKLSLLCGEKIVTAGSGRTDTGVHARGQVVSLTTSGSIPLENLLKACAGILRRISCFGRLRKLTKVFMPDTALVGNVIVIA